MKFYQPTVIRRPGNNNYPYRLLPIGSRQPRAEAHVLIKINSIRNGVGSLNMKLY